MRANYKCRGQTAPGAMAGLIISIVVVVIVVSQLFGAGIGPTENQAGYTTYVNLQTITWAGLALLSIAIIVMAASVILGLFRGGRGGL